MKDIKIIRFEFSDEGTQINLVNSSDSSRKIIDGKLHFRLQKPTTLCHIVVKLQGECLVTMTMSSASALFATSLFTFVKCHLINSQESILPSPQEFGAGDHCLPFTMSIRQDLPSSQEHKLVDKTVSITYRIGAVLEPSLNPLSKIVRSASHSKAGADSYEVFSMSKYTALSTIDLFPIKLVNYHGRRKGTLEYSFKVPEFVLIPLQRIHIRGSLLPMNPESAVDNIVVELYQQKTLSLVSKDPLRPSTYGLQECNPDVYLKVLGERQFKYESKQGQEPIDLGEWFAKWRDTGKESVRLFCSQHELQHFDIYFKSNDVVASFSSPMLDVLYFVRARIIFSTGQKDMVLKFPTELATVLDTFELPASPPVTDQVLPEYSLDEEAPSYDAQSSSL